MSPIIISGLLAASNTDVLANTRLQTFPSRGVVIVELQAEHNDGTNGFTATLNMPNGDTPMETTQVPAGVTAGGLNANDKLVASFRVAGGGHATLSLTEAGTSTCAYRVTFKPA